jgi:hypothetical protein
MVQSALRGVVRDALAQTAEHGLPGAHHFYISFRTDYPGVDIPDFLAAQYPEEMTIVLQNQFWGLEVTGAEFAVTLSFRNQNHRLTIPFAAVVRFTDPAAKFGLEFDAEQAAAPPGPRLTLAADPAAAPRKPTASDPPPSDPPKADKPKAGQPKIPQASVPQAGPDKPGAAPSEDKSGGVVRLDQFRKR